MQRADPRANISGRGTVFRLPDALQNDPVKERPLRATDPPSEAGINARRRTLPPVASRNPV
jgi:hypothetical protein